jgi:hypothetical protein
MIISDQPKQPPQPCHKPKCGSLDTKPLVARTDRRRAVTIWVCDKHRGSYIHFEDCR